MKDKLKNQTRNRILLNIAHGVYAIRNCEINVLCTRGKKIWVVENKKLAMNLVTVMRECDKMDVKLEKVIYNPDIHFKAD